MMDDFSKIYNKFNILQNNVLKLSDLLTLFQGAVPIDGCIIIAMTNKYEEIRKECPALFRAGRLTPVYFGYFDFDLVNQVSMIYFGKPLPKDFNT
jgi:hypothetical protein